MTKIELQNQANFYTGFYRGWWNKDSYVIVLKKTWNREVPNENKKIILCKPDIFFKKKNTSELLATWQR